MATLSYPSYPREYPPLPQLVPPSPGSFYPSPSPSSAAEKGSMPSAEYPQGQQQPPFWAGTSSSAPGQSGGASIPPGLSSASTSYSSPPLTATAAPTQTLPTPPTSDSEISKAFPISSREELANAAAIPSQQVVVSEPGVTSSAMLARRQNASLPAFSLPSSNTRNFTYGSMSTSATTPSLLTPPSVGSDSLSPLQGGGNGLYSNMGYWSQPSPSPSTYSFASTAGSSQSSYTTAPPMPNAMAFGGRNLYSPPGQVVGSQKDRPTTPGEAATPSTTYEGASFPTAVVTSSVPHMQYTGGYGFSQHPNQSPSNGPLSPHDHFSPGSLPPPTPHHIYPQQAPGYPYPAAASGVTSPNRPSTSTGIPQLHPQPIHPAPPPNLSGSHLALQSRYLPGMGMPAAGLMSQHGPHLLSGSPHHLGHALPHLHHSHPGSHAAIQQDRPFKCDQCPQSFNRNHDLKRHRRIHLAVKPFPCPNCDKSFSRKDALKRHVLVKGCGTSNNTKSSSTAPNGGGNGNGNGNTNSSPSRQSVSPLSS